MMRKTYTHNFSNYFRERLLVYNHYPDPKIINRALVLQSKNELWNSIT